MKKTLKVQELIERLQGLVPPEEILWVTAEADSLGSQHVIMKFRTQKSKHVDSINLILSYLPHENAFLWGKLEILVKPDLSAREFITVMYGRLIRMGCEVLVKSDGISIFRKLGIDISKESIKKSLTEICGVLHDNCFPIIFERAVVMD